MPKTAIVIGATGLIGSTLVKELAASTHYSKIVTITRRSVAYHDDKIENYVIDFEYLSEHVALFQGDAMFSCLGTTKKQAGSIAAQRKIDLDYQIIAAKLACDNKVGHYLLVSSSGANAQSASQYLKMKGELDDAIKAMPFKRISIVKPSVLLGERNHFRFGEKIAGALLPLLCKLPGLNRYRPIQGKQVAQKLVQLSIQHNEGIEEFLLDEVFPDNQTKIGQV
ncbi:MAG: NAD(P)H-binding protein [Psychrobium sp.]